MPNNNHPSSVTDEDSATMTIAGPSTSNTSDIQASAADINTQPIKQFSWKAGERFLKSDIDFILSWLECPSQFEAVFGSVRQTVIGKIHKPRTHGYTQLAREVSKNSQGRLNINGKNMRERFGRHMKIYRDTKRKSDEIGFGITKMDKRNNIYTVAQKLEKMCTCYARMDALFGKEPNITPLVERTTRKNTELSIQEPAVSSTVSQRRRRAIVEDEEDEEDLDVEYEEVEQGVEVNLVEGEVENLIEDETMSVVEINSERREKEVTMDRNNNKRTQDGLFDDDFESSFQTEVINELSLTSSINQRKSKHQLPDGEPQSPNKRNRVMDRRKGIPSLDQGSSPELPKRFMIDEYEKFYLMRNEKQQRLDLEKKSMSLNALLLFGRHQEFHVLLKKHVLQNELQRTTEYVFSIDRI
ncbi:hypothetical protein FBU30_010996 [Linnemannia zychae]|nr:hypothetical protein FBU30_010996 [Linnemannia zychae]